MNRFLTCVALACTCFAMPLMASTEFSAKGYSERQWARALSGDHNSVRTLRNALSRSAPSKRVIKSLHRFADRNELTHLYGAIEHILFNGLNRDLGVLYNGFVNMNGYIVRTSEAVVVPDHHPLPRVEYLDTVQVGEYHMLTSEPTLTPTQSQVMPMINLGRMQLGHPPYGYDNTEVLVCQLYGSNSGIYYEVRGSEINALLSRFMHPKYSNSCLSSDQAKLYWTKRASTFLPQQVEGYIP